MDYKKGDRVKHPGLPEWGLGEVLTDSRDDKVRIFFTEKGPKTLSLKHVEPVKIVGEDARHPVLDHLWVNEGSGIQYQSLQQSIDNFLQNYSDGFYGQGYLNGQRNFIVAAHDLALNLLGPEELNALIDQKDYQEICERTIKVVNATKLILPSEKTALKDGLKDFEQYGIVLRKPLPAVIRNKRPEGTVSIVCQNPGDNRGGQMDHPVLFSFYLLSR